MKENASFFMVRHGGSNYECEGTDITKEGFKQMEKAADDLIKRLDRDNDLIILVSSPKARAKGSLAVINRKIGEAGFRIVDLPKEKNIRKRLAGMVTMDVYGKMHEIESDEFNAVMDELWGEHVSMDDIKSKFQKWATQGNLRFLASGGSTNTHEEMVNDVKNELDFANRSVSFHAKKKKENERVVVVAVTHGEVIDTFLGKNGPGASASDEDWREVDYGEIVEIQSSAISFDELPFGFFVKIEGEESDIFEAAEKLKLVIEKKITVTYWDIFAEYKKENGLIEENIVFPKNYKSIL